MVGRDYPVDYQSCRGVTEDLDAFQKKGAVLLRGTGVSRPTNEEQLVTVGGFFCTGTASETVWAGRLHLLHRRPRGMIPWAANCHFLYIIRPLEWG